VWTIGIEISNYFLNIRVINFNHICTDWKYKKQMVKWTVWDKTQRILNNDNNEILYIGIDIVILLIIEKN